MYDADSFGMGTPFENAFKPAAVFVKRASCELRFGQIVLAKDNARAEGAKGGLSF